MRKYIFNKRVREFAKIGLLGLSCFLFTLPIMLMIYNMSPKDLMADETYGNYMQDPKTPKIAFNYSPVLSPETRILDYPAKSKTAHSSAYDKIINQKAKQHNVSPALVKAVIKVESNFNPNAVSASGAVGLMQIMPSTIKAMGGSNPFSPEDNINAGVKYLKMLLNRFNDNEVLALAAYNSGPGTVQKYGNRMPPYKETMRFVKEVMSHYNGLIES